MTDDAVTRRNLLAGAGATAAGGLLVVGLPDPAQAQRRPRLVGAGPTDRHGIGIICRIDQVGRSFTAIGYLTRVRGLANSALFTRAPARSTNDPRSADSTPARLTLHSQTEIQSLSTVGDVITTIASGSIRFFHQAAGGARFDNPGSFAQGTEVASLRGTFQTNLALDAPNQAGVALTSDLTQARARTFSIGGRRVRVGDRRLPWQLYATGRGHRTEPTTPRAQFFLTGELGVVDAERPR